MADSRHALIIANDRYDDQGLKKLRAPAQDAAALAEVLHDPKIGDFEVEVVRNQPVTVINRRIQAFFNDRRRPDTLLVHFSCHGLKSESGELYFAATDTDPRLLDATAIPAQFVHRCMRRTRAGSTVLFLDCCYGGAFSRGSSSVRAAGDVNVLESFTGDKPPGGRGWAVITASNSMEYAFEGPELAESAAPRPSVFTHAVVQGLETGEADLDADGEVSLDDLYDYVFDHVREQTPNQTPSRTVEMQGDLYLAHSRRGRIKIPVVPSPPSLLAAVHSDNAFTRQGAVVELRARLHDESLGIAEGARQDLEEIARNDIRQIADQACRALRDIRPMPSPDRLDFGLVPRGSTPQPRSVTLGGPPLAQHCVAQSTQPWLRVEPSEHGVNVRVETPTEGHLSGDILLKGVTDDAVVHVEAVVAPAREPEPEPGPEIPEPPPQPPPRTGPSVGPDTVLVHPKPVEPPPEEAPGITQDPAELHTPLGPTPPWTAPPEWTRPESTPPGSRRAPALAAAALALAVTALVTVVIAAQRAVEAVDNRLAEGTGGRLRDHAQESGLLVPLTTSLLTAAAALVFVALARLTVRRGRCTPAAAGATETMATVTKGLAIPALVLAALANIAYLVAGEVW